MRIRVRDSFKLMLENMGNKRKTKKERNRKGGLLAAVLLLLLGGFFGLDTAGFTRQEEGAADYAESTAGDSLMQVHYLDVGQGDATLIVCDGQAMLIDAGNNNQGTAVQAYLNSQNVDALEYVIGTHPDADHVGGLDVVITKFDCKTILLTEEEKDTNTYRDVLDAIQYKGYERTDPVEGDVYRLGSAEFTIVGPKQLGSDSNDNSIAIVLQLSLIHI